MWTTMPYPTKSRAAFSTGAQQVIQPKLKVGKPGDKYEQQADRVADAVMRKSDEQVQRQPVEEEEEAMQMQSMEEEEEVQMQAMDEEEDELQMQAMDEEEEDLQMQPAAEEEEELQMKCKECEEREKMQMKPAIQMKQGQAYASPDITGQINESKGQGRPLAPKLQREMSQKMGADFNNVNIHTDAKSASMNQALGARAFTVGNDIYFNSGEYNPNSSQGKHLLAHELTHTVQQGQSEQIQRVPSLGASAPAAANWQVVPADHQDRVNDAIDIIGRVINNRRCQNYFEDNCTNGAGANALQNAYDNAVIFNLNTRDSTYGSSINGTNDIAYNNTSYAMGRWFLASTLLHEMFHTCDPTIDVQDEIDAENAVEACRLYTPILSSVTPRSASEGDTITLEGISFGASQGAHDKVLFNDVEAGPASSWGYTGAAGSSRGQIKVTVPAGVTSGTVRVVNNNVSSNPRPFIVNPAVP